MSVGVVLALKILASVVICYFLGSLNASYLLGKAFKQKDVRNYGSHNPGSTNAIRTFGAKFGFICMAVDILKGVIAMLLVRLIMWHTLDQFETPPHHDLLVLIQLGCGIVCMLGHMYPFYMHFKGGKGIAVSLGVLIAINWKIFLIAGIPSLIILAIFRIMSVASLSFETLIFIMYIAFYGGHHPYGWFILLAALFYPLLGYYGHRANLKRLVHGEEPRLWGPGSPKYEAAKQAAADSVGDDAVERAAKEAGKVSGTGRQDAAGQSAKRAPGQTTARAGGKSKRPTGQQGSRSTAKRSAGKQGKRPESRQARRKKVSHAKDINPDD